MISCTKQVLKKKEEKWGERMRQIEGKEERCLEFIACAEVIHIIPY